ncbi:hypothetical protein RF11_00376 [Thelohanellus kitauei]|uniref:Uncharacterized protein n=1 Tax=Thelohanellus kitauei TaxID=669202 RepID=A0A0C2N427_THEKT|nr:hypothetical protein RF11_00376 [Thelohanellus kitauei]
MAFVEQYESTFDVDLSNIVFKTSAMTYKCTKCPTSKDSNSGECCEDMKNLYIIPKYGQVDKKPFISVILIDIFLQKLHLCEKLFQGDVYISHEGMDNVFTFLFNGLLFHTSGKELPTSIDLTLLLFSMIHQICSFMIKYKTSPKASFTIFFNHRPIFLKNGKLKFYHFDFIYYFTKTNLMQA